MAARVQLRLEQRSNRQRKTENGGKKKAMGFQGNSPREPRACTFTEMHARGITHSVGVPSGKR